MAFVHLVVMTREAGRLRRLVDGIGLDRAFTMHLVAGSASHALRMIFVDGKIMRIHHRAFRVGQYGLARGRLRKHRLIMAAGSQARLVGDIGHLQFGRWILLFVALMSLGQALLVIMAR